MRAYKKSWQLAGIVLAICGAHLNAAAPIYSFETLYDPPVNGNPPQPDPNGTRPDDFHINGGGLTITQDTVGATDGTNSLKISIVGGATFVGPLTELIPAAINDPNTTALALDLTIPSTGSFTGTFARIGLKEFGVFQGFSTDAQSDRNTAEVNIALAPGTYHLQLPLIAETSPTTGDSDVPFSSIYGPDPNTQATPTGFEFYINKSNDSPLTVYLDNVTALTKVTAPYPGDADDSGFVDSTDFGILVGHYLTSTTNGHLDGDFDNSGFVDSTDFGILVGHYLTGPAAPMGNLNSPIAAEKPVALPEPASSLALIGTCGVLLRRMPRRANSQ